MILKNNKLFLGALFLCIPSMISANITTLQSWDPTPIFNAANLNMPPDYPFTNNLKHRIIEDSTDKHRRWGINISPFVQKATRAQTTDNIYYGDTPIQGVSTPGLPSTQMSDYQGTPYLMGLFLGQDVNGNSIWGGPAAQDTGNAFDITSENVEALSYLGYNLQEAISQLNDNTDTTSSSTALLYGTGTDPNTTAPKYTSPSIFSQSVLEQDSVYFGAFSVPLAYQKAGFRWELNFDLTDNFGLIARGGFCQITQRTGPAISLTTLKTSSTIYPSLNTVANATKNKPNAVPTYTPAQIIFDQFVTNNMESLLDATNGADYDISTFSQTGIEDIQILGFMRHPFQLHPVDTDKFASVMLTPYVILGGTIPIERQPRDYSKLYSLPFGNNGHASVGGVIGLTLDFMNSIEFGFEFGATGFVKKNIDQLPMPNHELQRVLYPYRQNVSYSPGFNSQFAAVLNAYKFTHNVSFSLRYNYVQHNQDTITLLNTAAAPYFFPEMLEELSIWNSQMFTGALIFELQPSVFLSVAWQGALSQKNAYCSNTILTSLNFLF
jgi:hypothetical protein